MKTIQIPYYTSTLDIHVEEENLKAVIYSGTDEYKTDKTEAELVEEACRRTQLNTNSSDFRYADSILSRWHEAGITTIEQVKAEDARHAEKSAAARTRAKNAESRNNRFNDHSQREYSQGEMSSLELAMRNRH